MNSEFDRTAFIEAVRTLRREYQADPKSWENQSLDAFLGALAAYAKDIDGAWARFGKTVPAEGNWQVFAEILQAAAHYE